MIKSEEDMVRVEGTPKEICKDFTNIIIHLITSFEHDFKLSQEEALSIINECCKIAYMSDDERYEYLKELGANDIK